MKESTVLSHGATHFTAVDSTTMFADCGNRTLAYRVVGRGEPIILCHRFRANLDDWDPAFLDALAQNFTVITFDHSGFASSTGEHNMDALGYAKDVKDLAAALGLEKIIVGGWSLGGFVAQLVATEFPGLATHVILIGTRPPGKVEYGLEQIFLDTAYKPSYTVEDETILFFEPTSAISRKAAHESHLRIAARTSGNDTRIGEEKWVSYSRCAEDFDNDPYNARQKITETNLPILVVSADHEVCFPPENWFALNRKLPTTQIIIIPQAGHGPQHQYPGMIASYITTFIFSTK